MDGSDLFEGLESLLDPTRLEELQQQYRSLEHAQILRADLKFTMAAAVAGHTEKDIALFVNEYVEKASARAAEFDQTILQDQITRRTHHLDPRKIEEDFQEFQEKEREFHRYVEDAALRFAPTKGYTPQSDQRLLALTRLYGKTHQGIDREINPAVRQNAFDRARQKTEKLRDRSDPDDPFILQQGETVPHGDVGPGFFERLIWREHGNGTEDRIRYARNRIGLKRFIRDLMKVRLRESVTYHPTELEHADAVNSQVAVYEAIRALVRAKTNEEMIAAGRLLVERKKKVLDPTYSLIKLNDKNQIENFTPVNETENSRSTLILRMDAMEDIYHTCWRFMRGAWRSRIKPNTLLKLTFDYMLSLWGNVDIDGNYIKKSDEHGLAEAVANARDVMQGYLKRLRNAQKAGLVVQTRDGGLPWLERIAEAHRAFSELHETILRHERNNDLMLPNAEFTRAMDEFGTILRTLGNGKDPDEAVTNFKKDLEATYMHAARSNPEAAETVLVVSKLAHKFGWHGMILEYRQTAERHAEMIHHLLQIPIPGEEPYDYLGPKLPETLSPEDREDEMQRRYKRRKEFLNRKLLEDPNFLRRRIEAFRAMAPDADALRDTKRPEDLTFHTDRTMQLFARFPHLAKRAMLAEYESASHYLEMIAIQNACYDPATQRSASLDIAPLLEKVTTLKKFKAFYSEFVTTPAILKHLFRKGWFQTIMAAYSDNMKRFGITTRMAIDTMWYDFPDFAEQYCKTHKERINAALKEAGLKVRNIVLKILPDHGKSLLRPDHDGQRMITAQMKEHCAPFVSHLGGIVYIDLTAQNRDNTVKTREDYHRYLTRLFTEGSQLAAAHREGRESRRHQASEKLTNMVMQALESLQADYDRDYSSDGSPHCHALADTIVNNEAESSDGNGSSRGALRTGGNQQRNYYGRGPDQEDTKPISQGDMRAITLANDQAHLGSRNSFLGIRRFIDKVNAGFRDNPELVDELQDFVSQRIDPDADAFDKTGEITITVAGLQTLASQIVLPSLTKTKDEVGFGTNTSNLSLYARRQRAAIAYGKPMTAPVRQDFINRVQDFFVGTDVTLKMNGIDPALYEPKGNIHDILAQGDPLTNEELLTRIDRRRYLVRRLVMPLSAGELELSRLMAELGTRLRDNVLIRTYLEGDEKGDRPRTDLEHHIIRLIADEASCFIQPNALTVHDYPYAARRVENIVEDRLNAEAGANDKGAPIRHTITNPVAHYPLAA
jgi:hypothetical protein